MNLQELSVAKSTVMLITVMISRRYSRNATRSFSIKKYYPSHLTFIKEVSY